MMTLKISVVDMHTCGEPVRIVTEGFPEPAGEDILAKRAAARTHHDQLRKAIMLEPRGHSGMYGVIPVKPSDPAAAAAALFTHNEGYSTMCGHATIALGKWLIESGRVPADGPETSFGLELPCGTVDVTCTIVDGNVQSTSFVSVPAFLARRDITIDVDGLGTVTCDLCYGGAFYLILPSSALGYDFFSTDLGTLVELGTRITSAGRAQLDISHPDAIDLGFLYGTIITDDAPPTEPTYNLCIFAEGQIDRSPTGSGVTARMARDLARGIVAPFAERMFFGPTGEPMYAAVVSTSAESQPETCRVAVRGAAHYSGTACFELNPEDPLRFGFTLPRSFGEIRPPSPEQA